jgi:hypothetical protein
MLMPTPASTDPAAKSIAFIFVTKDPHSAAGKGHWQIIFIAAGCGDELIAVGPAVQSLGSASHDVPPQPPTASRRLIMTFN